MRYKRTKKILFFGVCLLVLVLYMEVFAWIQQVSYYIWIQYFPFSDILFQNYIFSGISLLIVNGLSNLLAAYLIIKDKK